MHHGRWRGAQTSGRLPVMITARTVRLALAAALAAVLCACASGGGEPETQAVQRPAAASPSAVGRDDAPVLLPVRFEETGVASWYGPGFHGRTTASGEVFDQHALTAAHPRLPLRSMARVTRLDTGQSVLVRINDRGPFVDGRVVDLSRAAAEQLDLLEDGLAPVRVEGLGPADPVDRAARSHIRQGS